MFSGNTRFKLVRRLGAGGMGVVYEAEDQQRKTRVALKTLQRADAHLLYRLKREFRSLRDLAHRNLVGLDELFEEGGNWFFTMELLDGDDLLTYLQRATAALTANTPDSTIRWPRGADEAPTHAGHGPVSLGSPEPPRERPVDAQPLDHDRVRTVFAQITEGLLALHEAGKIHRDIKPSNIIVTRDHRAVILDFGLVTEVWDGAKSGAGEIVGSVHYMAPEQAAANAVGPAADWYSVGVMLYEVLAGRRPFDGAIGVVIAAKQYAQPPDPRSLDERCPEDLARLCMELLQIEPADRPHGEAVLNRLGARGSNASISQISRPIPVAAVQRLFVGREAELRELQQAFDDVVRGAAVTAVVYGESGIGKSTLLHHFAAAIEREYAGTIVLTGQCREHEAVPFKAMDGIIDALAKHVVGLTDVAAAELVPQHAALLPGVFPVLGRIPSIADAPPPLHVASDPFQQRKRVFTALRDMLYRITQRYRLILVIDDMQWVDTDSLLLIGELLRPPDEPRLLLLASVRSADDQTAIPPLPGDVRRIRLPRLSGEESVELAGALLDRLAPEQRAQTARIVDETGGHPLFIGELVRYAAADGGAAAATQLRLDEAIWARAQQLDEDARRVLAVLAMAVAPIDDEVVHAATGLDAGRFQKAVARLRAGNLVRAAAAAEGLLEVYHDRVRQSVFHHVPAPERIALNGAIASALEHATSHVSPEQLIHHLEGAAQHGEAARKAIEAAERAQAGLAFERAITLFETALRYEGWTEAERRDLLIKLGSALASAGRGPDAADAYRRAAEGADPATQLSCRIQVADQLVQSGRLEGGASLLFALIREQGHEMPRSQVAVAVRILWYRMRLALRGLRWTDRKPEDIPARDQALLALYHAASRGLILVDPVRASYFVIRGLLLALEAGDRDRIMYFLVLETGFRGGEPGTGHRAFIERAQALMRAHDEPVFQSIYRLHEGSAAYLAIDAQFKEAFEILDRTDDELARTAHAAWWLSANRFFLIYSLHKMGDFARLRTYSERFVREAEQRGNVYTKTTLSRLCNILWLVDDDPAGARQDLTTDSWISYRQGYHSQHWLELNAKVEIAIYEGTPIERAFVDQHLAMLKKSFLQRVLGYGCDTQWLVGRLALSELAREPARRRVVQGAIARLRRYGTQFTRMLAAMLHGTLAIHDRDHATAIAQLREVVRIGDATNVQWVTAAARRRLGALIGGDEGRALVEAGDRWMREAGVKNPERMTELASPCARSLELLPETTRAADR